MFNVEELKRESGFTPGQLAQLETQLRAEFGEDALLRELHLMRLLEAVRRHWITPEEALREEAKAP